MEDVSDLLSIPTQSACWRGKVGRRWVSTLEGTHDHVVLRSNVQHQHCTVRVLHGGGLLNRAIRSHSLATRQPRMCLGVQSQRLVELRETKRHTNEYSPYLGGFSQSIASGRDAVCDSRLLSCLRARAKTTEDVPRAGRDWVTVTLPLNVLKELVTTTSQPPSSISNVCESICAHDCLPRSFTGSLNGPGSQGAQRCCASTLSNTASGSRSGCRALHTLFAHPQCDLPIS
jgi:hypothetical protein